MLEKENAAAKKAMKEAEKMRSAAKAPSILGDDADEKTDKE